MKQYATTVNFQSNGTPARLVFATKALSTIVELNDYFMFDEVYIDDEVCRITLPFVYKKYLLKFAEDKKLTYYMQGD